MRYVRSLSQFGEPDLIVLPGTKNTLEDLKWLKESGLAAKIQRAAGRGVPVIGICGGYQMLGDILVDPAGSEAGDGIPRTMEGLVYFGTDDSRQEKSETRAEGTITCKEGFWADLEGCTLDGYEIHMGETTLTGGEGIYEDFYIAGGRLPSGRIAAVRCAALMFTDSLIRVTSLE